jgi:hypothetical protein
MKQFVAGLVIVTAFGVTLASQRGRGSGELEFGTPPGSAFVNGGGNADAGSNEWIWYQRLNTDQPVAAIENFYRPKLAALGWRVTYAKNDTALALTRYAVGTAADARVGFLTVMPVSGLNQVVAAIHLVGRSSASPDTGRRGGGGAGFEGVAMRMTARQEMDRLIYESQPPAGESFARRPDVPAAFPNDVLPPRFVVDTVLTSATRTTVVGRVDNAGGSAVPALVLALQARGWHAPEEQYGLQLNAEISRPMCRGEHAAYLKFIDRPDHVLLASIRVTTTSQPCKPYEVTPNFPVPLLIVPPDLTARMQDGSGSAGSATSQVRIDTMSVPAMLAAFEPQVMDAGFHLESRLGDAVQTVAKFSTAGSTVTPVPGFHASALLFLTAVPGTHEIDALLTVYRHEPPGKK